MADTNDSRLVLWNVARDPEAYGPELHAAHVLEQYKLCVQMADKVSQRRGAANTFFISFNTALVGALAALFDVMPPGAAFAIYAAAIVLCATWALTLQSYRRLNEVKFRVIGLLEAQLPASPLYSAEWQMLGEGRRWRSHIPLTPLETLVPLSFIMLYGYFIYLNVMRTNGGL